MFQALLEELDGSYEIHCVDMTACHSNIYIGLLESQTQAFKEAMDSDNAWKHMAKEIPDSVIPEASGPAKFDLVKRLLKIFVYKGLQGGNLHTSLSTHEPLRRLFPGMSDSLLDAKGRDIISRSPALLELQHLRELVKPHSTIYMACSEVPFRYAFTSGASQIKRFPPFAAWDLQDSPLDALPESMKKSTTPQRVSRVFTGLEVVMLHHMVHVVCRKQLAVVLSTEHDGICVLVHKDQASSLVPEINVELEPFSERLTGRKVRAVGTVLARTP